MHLEIRHLLTDYAGIRAADPSAEEKLLASIVFFMREKYGSDCIARLMKASQGKDMGDALVEVCGKDAKGVEADWKAFYGVK